MEALQVENANLKRRITQLEKQPKSVTETRIVTIERPNENHLKALRLIQSITARELNLGVLPATGSAVAENPADTKPIVAGALRMLQVLAARYPMTFTKPQLALLANLSPKSGTYGTYLSLLRSQGLIEVGAEISLTEAGINYIGNEKPKLQTQEEVLAMWRGNLTGAAQRMFDVLVDEYPRQIDKAELGERTDMSYNSGTFGTYLSLLRRNGLAEVTGTHIKASSSLFVTSAFTQSKEAKQ